MKPETSVNLHLTCCVSSEEGQDEEVHHVSSLGLTDKCDLWQAEKWLRIKLNKHLNSSWWSWAIVEETLFLHVLIRLAAEVFAASALQ